MNSLFVSLFILFLISCNAKESGKPSPPAYKVHSEIEPYVRTFKTKMQLAGMQKSTAYLQATFSRGGDLNVGELGRCTLRRTSTGSVTFTVPILVISSTWWDIITSADREELIYHELGHCILGKLHITTLVNQVPVSIMHPTHMGEVIYTDNYGVFMAELFSNPSAEILALEFDDTTYF